MDFRSSNEDVPKAAITVRRKKLRSHVVPEVVYSTRGAHCSAHLEPLYVFS